VVQDQRLIPVRTIRIGCVPAESGAVGMIVHGKVDRIERDCLAQVQRPGCHSRHSLTWRIAACFVRTDRNRTKLDASGKPTQMTSSSIDVTQEN
jgi:hypothetical protein